MRAPASLRFLQGTENLRWDVVRLRRWRGGTEVEGKSIADISDSSAEAREVR